MGLSLFKFPEATQEAEQTTVQTVILNQQEILERVSQQLLENQQEILDIVSQPIARNQQENLNRLSQQPARNQQETLNGFSQRIDRILPLEGFFSNSRNGRRLFNIPQIQDERTTGFSHL